MLQKSLIAAVLSAAGGVNKRGSGKDQAQLPRRILVVDDDEALRQLCSEALTGFGFRVDIAKDGEAGWKMLDAARRESDGYDLLITDYNMPKITGGELIRKLRSARMFLPVILVSGSDLLNAEPDHLAESPHLASILAKPFSLDQLVKTVRAVLLAAKRPSRSR